MSTPAPTVPPSLPPIPGTELRKWILDNKTSDEIRKEFSNRTIEGDVNVMDLTCPVTLIIEGATFQGHFLASGASFQRSLQLPRCIFEQDVWMVGTKVDGLAAFREVAIGKDWNLHGAIIGSTFTCTNSLPEDKRPKIAGNVDMSGMTVGGAVNFSGIHIAGSWDLSGAVIKLGLYFDSRSVEEPRSEVSGDVTMMGTKVSGPVGFAGVKIGGTWNLEQGIFDRNVFAYTSKKFPQPTEIGKDVLFNGTTVKGETTFLGATIGGDFRAVRADFDDGLYLGVGTNDIYEREFRGTVATTVGAIDLSHSRVGGTLHLTGTQVMGSSDTQPVNLSFVDVQGDCRLIDDGQSAKRMTLFHAKLGNLSFGGGNLPEITADGLSFRRLQLPNNEDDPLVFLDSTGEFHKSVYRFLEKYLSEQGRDDQADIVHREMKRRDRRQEIDSVLVWLDVALFEWLGQLLWLNRPTGRGWALMKLAKDDKRKKTAAHPPAGDGETDPTPRAEVKKPKGPSVLQSLWVILPLALITVLTGYLWGWYALIPAVALLLSSGRLVRWMWNVMLDVTTGCGTASERLGIYLLAVFVILTVLFLEPHSVRHVSSPSTSDLRAAQQLQQKDSKAAMEQMEPTLHPATGEWGLPEATFMSVRVTLPMIDLLAAKDWEPSNLTVENGPAWLKYDTLCGWLSLISYMAVPLFVASVTGFLKRRGA